MITLALFAAFWLTVSIAPAVALGRHIRRHQAGS